VKSEAFPVVEKVLKKPKIDISKLDIDSDESEGPTHSQGRSVPCKQRWDIKTEYCVVDFIDKSWPRRNTSCEWLSWEKQQCDCHSAFIKFSFDNEMDSYYEPEFIALGHQERDCKVVELFTQGDCSFLIFCCTNENKKHLFPLNDVPKGVQFIAFTPSQKK
jgi:hypothetical protein